MKLKKVTQLKEPKLKDSCLNCRWHDTRHDHAFGFYKYCTFHGNVNITKNTICDNWTALLKDKTESMGLPCIRNGHIWHYEDPPIGKPPEGLNLYKICSRCGYLKQYKVEKNRFNDLYNQYHGKDSED